MVYYKAAMMDNKMVVEKVVMTVDKWGVNMARMMAVKKAGTKGLKMADPMDMLTVELMVDL